ncbi:PQQ-dependent sugar dehydrogenase [Anoxybacterium hadale]
MSGGKFNINSLFLIGKKRREFRRPEFLRIQTKSKLEMHEKRMISPYINTPFAAEVSSPSGSQEGFPFEVQVIAEDLNVPWAMDISQDGRIYFTERPGTLRMIQNGVLYPEPIMTFQAPFISEGEGGLLGIVLDPDFLENHFIYVMHSYSEDNQIYNRVVRLIEQNNRAFIDQVLIDRIPGGLVHNGGRIKIGPDGKLYISTGDAGNTSFPQNLSSTAGKILRIELDGRIPADNPYPGSPVYSYGLRNPQGLAWDSANNVMYASDHGSEARDEINLIIPGGNYGWPLVTGDEESNELIVQKPLVNTGTETWAPSGIAYLDQGPWQNRLLVATLRGQKLMSILLSEDGTAVQGIEPWLQREYGRLRDVIQADDGSIYISTSNRDGRGGVPRPEDDRIIRLIPRT